MRGNGRYVLDKDGNPVEEPDLMTWAHWMEGAERIVAQDFIGGWLVSTIFIGLDYRCVGNGPPILWETMIFSKTEVLTKGPYHLEQRRYTSQQDALEGHRKFVQMLTS